MLPAVIIAALIALAALHYWWRAKLRQERANWQARLTEQAAQHHTTITEARTRQDALLDSMIEGVLVLDETGRVQFANSAFAEMFNTAGVLRGKTLIEAVRLHEVVEIVERTKSEGRVVDHELRLGIEPERWLQINAAALSSVDRRKLGVIVVFHDLTRTKQLERTRQEFVANVSHELRTPLAALVGFIETLRGTARDDPAARDRFLGIMEREAGRMIRLVNDLLSLSRVEAEERRRPDTSVDVIAVLRTALASHRDPARQAGVDLVLDAEEESVAVRADADQLAQVFHNLVENAIKYGGAGHLVTVRVRRIAREPVLRGPAVQIDVIDRGEGIDPLHLPRLTERFYRVDSDRSRAKGGTGLGLAIVKHIVNRHRGRFRIESEVGKGSRFIVILPKADPDGPRLPG